jgi:hypothetical protein
MRTIRSNGVRSGRLLTQPIHPAVKINESDIKARIELFSI